MKNPARFFLPSALLLAGGLSLLPSLSAQVILHRWKQVPAKGIFDVQQLSDVDGDGIPEILLWDQQTGADAEIWIYSLARQQILVNIPTGTQNFANLRSSSDLDGDGLRDMAASFLLDFPDPPTQRLIIKALSGLDGSPLWVADPTLLGFQFLNGVAPVGDINGDGVEDIAATLGPGGTHGTVISGVDGTFLLDLTSNDVFGVGVFHPAGDINGDGFNDIIDYTGNVEFFSGKDGSVLLALPFDTQDGHLRAYVVGVGDVNGDGRDDWAEGWRGDTGDDPPVCITPFLKVFSGIPPRKIDEVAGRTIADPISTGPFFHHDFDGDGVDDILFWGAQGGAIRCGGVPSVDPGYVSIRSTARKKTLITWANSGSGCGFDGDPLFLEDLSEDWDGDGHPDLLVTRILYGGEILALSTGKRLTLPGNSLSRSAGGTLTFRLNAGPRYHGRRAFLLPGGEQTWPFFFTEYTIPFVGRTEGFGIPFILTPLTNRVWDHRGDPRFGAFQTRLDAEGKGTFQLSFAPGGLDQSLVGKIFHFAALLESPVPEKPETATEAVRVRIDP